MQEEVFQLSKLAEKIVDEIRKGPQEMTKEQEEERKKEREEEKKQRTQINAVHLSAKEQEY